MLVIYETYMYFILGLYYQICLMMFRGRCYAKENSTKSSNDTA